MMQMIKKYGSTETKYTLIQMRVSSRSFAVWQMFVAVVYIFLWNLQKAHQRTINFK